MTNSNAPRGAQSFNGIMSTKFDLRINKYVVDASDPTPLFMNDLVKTTGQSDAEGTPIVTKISSQGDFIVGIVVDFEKDADANLPIYRKANTRRIVHVCDDPFVKFEMQVSGAFTLSDAGKKANIVIGSGDTTLGLSTSQLDSTTFTNNDAQIKMLRLVESEDNELGTHAKVECTIFKHEAFFFDGVVAGENIFFVRQNGDDTQDGKSWEEAFETLTKASIEATAIASPTTNPLIKVADSGTYYVPLGIALLSNVTLDAQNANIEGQFYTGASNSTFKCKSLDGFFNFFDNADLNPNNTAYFEAEYVRAGGVPAVRAIHYLSGDVTINTLDVVAGIGISVVSPFGGASDHNVFRINTILLGANNTVGIDVEIGHATIIVGQIIKTGAFTGTTGIRVGANATADIIVLGKNEADTPLTVNDHNHNLISTSQGILIRGNRPLFSAKGYASTQTARIETSYAEGTPASPATILPTADLGARIAYGERQDGSFSGQQPYVEIRPTTQAGDIEDGRLIINVNDVQAAGGSVINHILLDYAAKTGGQLGEFAVPLQVAGFSMPTADGALGEVLRTNGSKVLSFSKKPVSTQFGVAQTIASPAAQIPYDGTPPLISEGTLITNFSLTPVFSGTGYKLKINVSLTVWVDADVYVTVAFFESVGSTLIGKRTIEIKGTDAANNLQPLDYTFYYTPTTTVSRTYTARIGPSGASALTVNGEGAGEALIINYSSFTIEEVPI